MHNEQLLLKTLFTMVANLFSNPQKRCRFSAFSVVGLYVDQCSRLGRQKSKAVGAWLQRSCYFNAATFWAGLDSVPNSRYDCASVAIYSTLDLNNSSAKYVCDTYAYPLNGTYNDTLDKAFHICISAQMVWGFTLVVGVLILPSNCLRTNLNLNSFTLQYQSQIANPQVLKK